MDKNKDFLRDLWYVSGVNEDIWSTLMDNYNNATTKEEKYNALAHIKWHLGYKMDDGKLKEVKLKIDGKGYNNGFEYIDLDLPSKTLWATCNVGAAKPTDGGLYFQFGDSLGYTADQVGSGDGKKKFDWGSYKWNPSADGKTFTKYNQKGGQVLDLEDDAAHAYMQGDWHMPSPSQLQELISNTTVTWTTLDGVVGNKFTSKKDESRSIFIPESGYVTGTTINDSASKGYIWSSTLRSDYLISGQILHLLPDGPKLETFGRYNGLPTRGVIG